MPQELIAEKNLLELKADAPVEGSSLWQSLRNCWLLIPLMYFATNGALLIQGGGMSSSDGFAGPTASESAASRGVQAGIWGLSFLLMYPYYRSIVRAFKDNKAVTALLAFTVISVLWSPDILDSIRRATLLVLTFCFAYFLTQRFRHDELMRLIYFTGCLAALASLGALAFLPGYAYMPTGEWQGIFGHKNDLGIFLCFMLSPALFTPLRASIRAFAGYICALLGVVLIVGSQSRGAWVVVAALLAYTVLLQMIRKMSSVREAVALTAALLAGAGIVGWLAYQNYATITYMMGKDPTLTNRGRIWSAVLGAISKHPLLGYGYGGFWNGLHGESIKIVTAVGVNITHAHNGYLNLTLQIGLVGLALFVIVLMVAGKNAIVSIYNHRSRAALWYGAILLMTVVASSDESFLMNYNALTTILFVIACVGLRSIASGEEVG
jgi:O-antigen ligase